jgi:septum site-determining protein MinC
MADDGQGYHNRIADLLDDITVANETAPQSASSEPLATPPAAPSTPANPPVQTGMPGAETPAPANRDEPGALPPFLRQPSAPAGSASSLPGTALFASAAKAAPHAEQPVPPADGDETHTATVPALPPAVDNGAVPPAAVQGEAQAALAGANNDVVDDATAVAGTADAAAADATAAEAVAPPGPPISIRGRSDGLVIEIGKGSWSEILAALDDRLQQSASFFRNARVALDLGARLTPEAELMPLVDLLKTHGLALGSVRTSSERTFQAALALGLTTTLESTEGVPVADAAPAATNTSTGTYFVYRGYLRSGHRLQRKESVLVIGDVNPGAEVSSDGDVLVWGRLRGVVHAGAAGNARAIVAALDLEPTQLRIADVMTIGPDPRPGQPGKWFWKRSATKRPEIARIANETISIEEWDATRPGGIVSLRRGG